MKTRTKSFGKGLVLSLVLAGAMGTAAVYNPYSASAVADQPGQYASDYASIDATRTAARSLISEIANEGMVLLKNDDNLLPLSNGARLTAMGRAYGGPVNDGGGSGALGSTDQNQTWATSLTGAGFNVGTAFTNNNDGGGNGTISGTNTASSTYTVNDARLTTFEQYSDAAVVFIGRGGAENVRSSTNYSDISISGISSPDGHILEFDNNERNLLSIANENFENVIVVINANNAMELGELMDGTYASVKAVVWAGIPGPDGNNALGRILSGEVNPSGRLADTYVRDLTNDPTWQNFGTNAQTGSTYRYNGNGDAWGVYYEEGIYVGYKYYETADFEAKNNNYEGFDYDEQVVFPFGYGLSYTTFDWEVLSYTSNEVSLTSNSEISVKVKVTNTGDVAGKDVVQLYYTAPYTSGEIEKSYKNLGDFAKTKMLQPNESDVVTLNISLREMSSYDYNDANDNSFIGYEADAGDYLIHIAHNAHDSEDDEIITYNLANGVRYGVDEKTGTVIANRFDDVTEGFDESATAFSRADFATTFPVSPTTAEMTKDANFISLYGESITLNNTFANGGTSGNAQKYYDNDNPWYVDGPVPVTGQTPAEGTIMLGQLTGRDYDDPLWDTFIQQLTVDQMVSMVTASPYNTSAITNLGIPATTDQDGPQTINRGIPYPTEVVLAATWNADLAYRMGRMVANEGMWRNTEVWYAPAMNIHRSAFGARNFEYYSECPILSGKIGAAETRGATDKGLAVTLKHFAFNEQETGRSDVAVWASEQALREIYLKPFELSVKDGGALGVMSAFGFIGTTWTGGSYALLTQILRDEWGFRGFVVTDYGAGSGMMDLSIRTGGDRSMASGGPTNNSTNATHVTALQKSCKNMLYVKANSYAMQTRRMDGFNAIAYRQPTVTYSDSTHNMLIGEEYIERVMVNDSTLDYAMNYEVTEGTLPAGLTLTNDGLLTGAATEAGNFTVTVTASAGDNIAPVTAELTISVTSTSLEYSPKLLDEGRQGREYTADVATAEGGYGSITYALKEGSTLPAGLTLSEDGVISGTPTVSGHFEFTVVASSGESDDLITAEQTFTIDLISEDAVLTYDASLIEMGSAKVGSQYSVNIARAQGSNNITYTLGLDGDAIPTGLEIVEGRLTGIPTEAGNYIFHIVASAPNYDAVSVLVTLTIAPEDAAIVYEDLTLASGRVGTAYSQSIATATGAQGITYALKEGSALPIGLTLRDGVISGTPTTNNEYTFVIVASASGYDSVEAEISLTVEKGIIAFNGSALNEVTIWSSFRADISVSAPANVTYAVKEGSSLPAGLTLNANRGVISGTPSQVGGYSVTIVASAEGYNDSEATFTIVVMPEVEENITYANLTLAGGRVGTSYTASVATATGAIGITYALKEGSTLPAGLTLTNGVVSGTPAAAGTYTFVVVASAEDYTDVEATVTLVIANGVISYNGTALANGAAGDAYTASVATATGATGITYALKEGSTLPEGLTLSADGTISGTPATSAGYTITVVASATGYDNSEATFTLVVTGVQDVEPEPDSGCGSSANLIGMALGTASVLGALAAVTVVRRKRNSK